MGKRKTGENGDIHPYYVFVSVDCWLPFVVHTRVAAERDVLQAEVDAGLFPEGDMVDICLTG